MSTLIRLLNGTSLSRDAGFMASPSNVHNPGVRLGFMNGLEITTSQVDTGMAFVEITRTNVSPNETFLLPVLVNAAETIDTTGTGWIIISVDQTKINDGSANAADGSGIATVEKVTSLPSSNYLILATLASGVIADAREWARISETAIPDTIHYATDSGAADAYVMTLGGISELIDGQHYRFKATAANTGASTLNVNSFGAKSIRKTSNAVLASGDIKAGAMVEAMYDASNDWFQMTSQLGNAPGADVLVGASATDTTPGYLDDKIEADFGLEKIIQNPAGNETILIQPTAKSGNIVVMPAGETITITDEHPLQSYIDDDETGKVKILDGSTIGDQANQLGFVLTSGSGDVEVKGFDTGDANEFYQGDSTTDHITSNTTPTSLKTSLTNQDAPALDASDGTHQTTATTNLNSYAYQMLEFDVGDASFATNTLDLVEILVEANGGGTTLTDGWNVNLWNFTTSQWEEVGASTLAFGTDESITDLSKMRTVASIADYVDGTGEMYLLLQSADVSDGANAINIASDFARIIVSQGVKVQTGGTVYNLEDDLIPGKTYYPALVGSHSSNTIGGGVASGVAYSIGSSSVSLAYLSRVSNNENFAGYFHGNLTLKLRKVGAGQTAVIYLIRTNNDSATISSTVGQGFPGCQVVEKWTLSAASMSTTATEYEFALNKYLPKGQYYILMTTDNQAISGTNYFTVSAATAAYSGSNIWDYDLTTPRWDSSTSDPIWVGCTSGDDYTPDPDGVKGHIARTLYEPGAQRSGIAVGEHELDLTPRKQVALFSNAGFTFGANTNDAISGDYLKVVTGFRAREIYTEAGDLVYAEGIRGTASNNASIGFIEDDGFTITANGSATSSFSYYIAKS